MSLSKSCIKCNQEFYKKPKASLVQWQGQKYCSYSCAGLSKSPPISQTCPNCLSEFPKPDNVSTKHFLRYTHCSRSCAMSTRREEKSPKWKGDQVGYHGIHSWMYRNFGKASRCENPKCPVKTTNYQWANISGEYRRERNDWMELCGSCHQLMDRKNVCGRGHELTPENSYTHPKHGRRHCKTCARAATKRYLERKRLSLLPS